jgi:hypothetical protein
MKEWFPTYEQRERPEELWKLIMDGKDVNNGNKSKCIGKKTKPFTLKRLKRIMDGNDDVDDKDKDDFEDADLMDQQEE